MADVKDAKGALKTAAANNKAYLSVSKAIDNAKLKAVQKAEKTLLVELKKVAKAETKLVANALKRKRKTKKK